MRKWIFSIAALLFMLQSTNLAQGKSILILNSYHETFAWTDALVRGMKSVLRQEPHQFELVIEYMDSKRFKPEPHYLNTLESVFRKKHATKTFDVIITTDNNALDFLVERYDRLFPNRPVVFCGVNNFSPEMLHGNENITGVVESPDIAGTIAMAQRLHPNLRKVYILTDDTPTGIMNRAVAQKFFSTNESIEAIYINGSDFTLDEVTTKLKNLPSDSIVFFLDFWRDKTGAFFSSRLVVPLFSHVSSVATYSHNNLYFTPRGIVGGKLNAGFYHGQMAAQMALKILQGKTPKDLPINLESPTRCIVDYKQLEKHGIDPSRLPKGTIVENKPFSIYESYWKLIWATIATIVLLLLLVIVLTHNIVKRKEAERALREEQDRLLAIFEAANSVAFVTYRLIEGKPQIHEFSPGAEAIFGYGKDEIEGSPPDLLRACSTNDMDLQDYVLDDSHGLTRERALLRKSGQVFDGLVTTHPLLGEDGRLIAVLDVIIDLTERKQAEAEQKRLEAQIRHSQKLESLGVLAGGIAHDFNNLLMAIHGNAELALKDPPHSDLTQQSLEEILLASKRASDLTNQLLAYSGRSQVVKSSVNVNELVSEMSELLNVSKSKKAEITYDLSDDIDTVEGDIGQLRQVVMNLITNASEAIGDKEGMITIRTGTYEHEGGIPEYSHVQEALPPGHYIFFEVIDTGCGMDNEALNRLFEPFYTTKFTGRGLGLAAVLGIVRSHSGAICISSKLGEGTTFRVILPPNPSVDEDATTTMKVTEVSLSGLTFLVVDDELVVREVAARMLEKAGATVYKAADGREAIEIYREHSSSINGVLLDITMPKMDGQETARELWLLDEKLPVVFASGYSEKDSIGLQSNAQPFIQKPFEFGTLVETLRTLTLNEE